MYQLCNMIKTWYVGYGHPSHDGIFITGTEYVRTRIPINRLMTILHYVFFNPTLTHGTYVLNIFTRWLDPLLNT